MTTTKSTKVRGIIAYKSYVFKDKDPVIDLMRTAVEDSGLSYKRVNAASGVSYTTLHNWFKGDTRRPQFATVNAVARALGKEFKLVDRRPSSATRAEDHAASMRV